MLHVAPPYAVQQFQSWAYHMLKSKARAHEYRRWALEAEREGRIDRYRRLRNYSDQEWTRARFALSECRYFKRKMQ